jgi:hypothetical protein
MINFDAANRVGEREGYGCLYIVNHGENEQLWLVGNNYINGPD